MSFQIVPDPAPDACDRLAAVNDELEAHAFAHRLDENFLRRMRNEILAAAPENPLGALFLLARLNELALFLAGAYADAGLIREAGDLLINPPAVDVRVHGLSRPVRKKRHTPLTLQFGRAAGDMDPKDWLREHADVVVVEHPILVQLAGALESFDAYRPGYGASVRERQQRIADTINIICALHLPGNIDFAKHLYQLPPDQRVFMEDALCHFNLNVFWEIGRSRTISGFSPNPGNLPDETPLLRVRV